MKDSASIWSSAEICAGSSCNVLLLGRHSNHKSHHCPCTAQPSAGASVLGRNDCLRTVRHYLRHYYSIIVDHDHCVITWHIMTLMITIIRWLKGIMCLIVCAPSNFNVTNAAHTQRLHPKSFQGEPSLEMEQPCGSCIIAGQPSCFGMARNFHSRCQHGVRVEEVILWSAPSRFYSKRSRAVHLWGLGTLKTKQRHPSATKWLQKTISKDKWISK